MKRRLAGHNVRFDVDALTRQMAAADDGMVTCWYDLSVIHARLCGLCKDDVVKGGGRVALGRVPPGTTCEYCQGEMK